MEVVDWPKLIWSDCFLSGCSELLIVNLSELTGLILIGNTFLRGCDRLTEIYLRGLIGLKSIGNIFLYKCTGLKKVMVFSECLICNIVEEIEFTVKIYLIKNQN